MTTGFLIGFSSGFFMFLAIFMFLVKLLVKSINKKDEIIYRLYHEGQLPIMARVEGLAIVVKLNSNKSKKEIDLLINEIKLLKFNIKETLIKIK